MPTQMSPHFTTKRLKVKWDLRSLQPTSGPPFAATTLHRQAHRECESLREIGANERQSAGANETVTTLMTLLAYVPPLLLFLRTSSLRD